MNKSVKIKVCGMRDPNNIGQLVQLPIDYIGFIFYPKSPRYVQGPIGTDIPNSIQKTGVFVNDTFENIMDKVASYRLQAVQLHGSESSELCNMLKEKGVEVIKAFGIDDSFHWPALHAYLDCVDYFLFDTKSAQHGGTGQTFNWAQLAGYPYATPYFLSGGLALENLQEAISIRDNRLYALDLNSKFELEPGLKNIETLTQALTIIKDEQIPSR